MTTNEALLIKAQIEQAFPFVKKEAMGDAVYVTTLADYKHSGIKKSLDNYIKLGNKYAPSLGTLISGYVIVLSQRNESLLELMDSNGEFMDKGGDIEIKFWNYENRKRKAIQYLDSGIMPEWFRELVAKYQHMSLSQENTKKLT
jgi:hypothetical protein